MKAWMILKFRPDTTTNTRVICPCTSEKLMYYVVNTQAPLFLIRSKFDQIGPWTGELAALEHLEKTHRLIMGEILWQSCAFIFNFIFFILADNEGMYESLGEFEFRQICNRVTALD